MFEFAIITAAGKATRLLPLSEYIPKAMVRVGGTTLIGGLIRQLRGVVPNIVVTVGHMGNILANHVVDEGVSAIINTDRKSDSWWIFNTLLSRVEGPVLVLACDLIVDLDIEFIYDAYRTCERPACMIVPLQAPADACGHFILGEGNVVKKFSRDRISDELASGIFVVDPTKIARIVGDADCIEDMWTALIKLGELRRARKYPKSWMTIDSIDQLGNHQKTVMI